MKIKIDEESNKRTVKKLVNDYEYKSKPVVKELITNYKEVSKKKW